MSSFAKLCVFPVGYFRSYSSWLLRQRREVARRIDVINAEITRIGDVTVVYAEEPQPDGSIQVSETRVGFSVTPKSSLGKLLKAYVARGGNPLDISPFMTPESTLVVSQDAEGNPIVKEQYPHGGVAAPMSAEANEPFSEGGQSGYSPHPGGYINMDSYYPARQGGRTSPGSYDHDAVVKSMHLMRSWAAQDISEMRRLEWQIIKLCDLREQLIQERDDVLVQAFGGVLAGVGPLNTKRFNPDMLVQNLIQEMSDLIYLQDASGAIPRGSANVPLLKWVLLDVPSELRDPLGC